MLNTFNYHDVGSKKSKWAHTKEDFLTILKMYEDSPFPPEIITNIRDIFSKDLYTLLTFDDGRKSSMFIADELEKRDWRGHFFIPTITLEESYRNDYLTANEIRELHSRGHIIGSHSHTHTNFINMQYIDMLSEWVTSKSILEDILGFKVIYASIPNGYFSDEVAKSAARAGYDYLFTSIPTIKPWYNVSVIACIGRVSPKGTTRLSHVQKLINCEGYWIEDVLYTVKSLIKMLKKEKNGTYS